ncbi:MAG: ligase-associated DNA damage response endonuclease PdeM [Methylocystis sp.]|jgi:DNA ligase-associated metallophosphoesterase|nr:ligase-associated DNA damage response endonuclease PdeM [Methylocystis sp.]MCA3582729.1 ligase-associated DNA damage response endonuclease PdeM [Methylocystis sp.]MCA3587065.1 ligase-associated DNA damage response endonuclease PdeM [Methylocystis sp.]MCA3592026.1 ligase-associated DNA damage response endonuclease PdeM [Methylocystis sp.]
MDVVVNGARLKVDHHGAAWWPETRTLVVADMHLEKGSAFASRGQMLPPYDSAATLARLAAIVARHRPDRLIALGDSFHDAAAGDRMEATVMAGLAALAGTLEMIWITGNHDPEIPPSLPGRRCGEVAIGPLTFRHEPGRGHPPGEIAGHLHPVARVVSERGSVRRRAFISDGARLLMPAFGAYAGGLNCLEDAIASLFQTRSMIAHVCGRTRVYSVGGARLG